MNELENVATKELRRRLGHVWASKDQASTALLDSFPADSIEEMYCSLVGMAKLGGEEVMAESLRMMPDEALAWMGLFAIEGLTMLYTGAIQREFDRRGEAEG